MKKCECKHERTITGIRCGDCGGRVRMDNFGNVTARGRPLPPAYDGDKDYATACTTCGEKPTVHPTGLCGPCCFGEAETYGGNW